MRIGVVSDTHDRLPTIYAALEQFSKLGIQTVIHPGDGRLFVNPGECCGWVTGRATVAAIDLDTSRVELIEVPT